MKINTLFYLSFSFLLSTHYCLQCPIGLPVTSVEECYSYSNSTHQCCFLKTLKGESICYNYNINSVIPSIEKWGVTDYQVFCGKNSTVNPPSNTIPNFSDQGPYISTSSLILPDDSLLYGIGLSNCGIINPKKLEDCSLESTVKQSCCFYSYKNNNSMITYNFLATLRAIQDSKYNEFIMYNDYR